MGSVTTLEPNSLEKASSAYRLASDSAISSAYPWQAELFRRITDSAGDIGGLLLAPLGSGKIEAAVIPALGSMQGATQRRLFLIGPDHSPLDDYYSRLVPYLRVLMMADGTARTICMDIADEDAAGNICRRFFPDGTEDPHILTNPLDVDVDLILTTFSRFRELFFGNGGVHVLPTALIGLQNQTAPRDLFFSMKPTPTPKTNSLSFTGSSSFSLRRIWISSSPPALSRPRMSRN